MAARQGRERDFLREDQPPFSRLFVIHGKGCDPEALRTAFEKYGDVQDVWSIKDRVTGEGKGFTYIKFSKASEATLAMEELTGKYVEGHPKPLKVVMASSRSEGSVRDPAEDIKMLRLFVIIPKSFSEDDLEEEFKQFGDIDKVTVLKDKATGDPKGFGYVKFHRAYHAALALEQCDPKFKPKFADPKMSDRKRNFDDFNRHSDRGGHGDGPYSSRSRDRFDSRDRYSERDRYDRRRDDSGPAPLMGNMMQRQGQGMTMGPSGQIEAKFSSSSCSPMQLNALFDLIPGLEHFDYNPNTCIAYAQYSSSQSAQIALMKLPRLEYPPGCPIMVRPAAQPAATGMDFGGPSRSGDVGNPDLAAMVKGLQGMTNLQDAQGLVQALQQISNIFQGRQGGGGTRFGEVENPDGSCSVNYFSKTLPTVKPKAESNPVTAERLFIVCQPQPISLAILDNLFCRFGSLIDIYLVPGKNYGYVRYAEKESAQRAIEKLHLQEVDGQLLKVLKAEPRRGDDEPETKRQKSDSSHWD